MAVIESDVVFRKSSVVTDGSANGGIKSQTLVVSGSKHNLFPRITNTERLAGITRYRKEFWSNENSDNDIAYGVVIFFEFPSNSGDRFYLVLGTQTDIQGDISIDADALWVGCGQLNSNLSGGETAVEIAMENDDFDFIPGAYLHISNKFSTGQTIDSAVKIGDSVEESAGTWNTIAATTDITYPKGIYVGSNTVLTEKGSTKEEFLTIQDQFTDEDIGTGDGAATAPVLSTLVNNANGIMTEANYLPVVTTQCGSVTRTVNIAADGSASGYCDAGQLNMITGVWTTDINWTTAPDNLEDILIDYYEYPFSYSGNIVTVKLESGVTVANAYTTATTYAAGCLNPGDIVGTFDNWAETSAAGTYDESTYPPVIPNVTEEETWTLEFTSPTAFTATGAKVGYVGTGAIGSNFAPLNPNNGEPYFTISRFGWGGSWISGDTIVFKTHPAAVPIWLKEIVPPAAAAIDRNLLVLGYYTE